MTMKAARLRLNHAMGLVFLAALDLAMLRISGLITGGAPHQFRLQMIVLVALPMANLLGIALILRSLRSGSCRRFLEGFAISAAITSASLFASAAFLDLEWIMPPMGRLGHWLATTLLGRSDLINTRGLLILMSAFASIFTLPQVLLALLSGLVASKLGSRRIPKGEIQSIEPIDSAG
jgi:hypothetical protein